MPQKKMNLSLKYFSNKKIYRPRKKIKSEQTELFMYIDGIILYIKNSKLIYLQTIRIKSVFCQLVA